MLRAGRVKVLVALAVVRLLEKNVRPYSGFLELAEVLDGCCRNVDVDAPNVAVLVVNAVDCADALENVIYRVVDGVFTKLDGKPFVAHVLQRDNFGADFFLRELLAGNGLVLRVVGTVKAAVYAVVREVERRKQHNAIPVEGLLYFFGDGVNLRDNFWVFASKEH